MNVAIIAGGRDFTDFAHMVTACDYFLRHWRWSQEHWTIIIGISKEEYIDKFKRKDRAGADFFAYEYARLSGHLIETFPADWVKYGRPAGPIRNRQMAERAAEFLPSAQLIAFWDRKSPGTASMIAEAKRAGLNDEQIHIEYYNK